MYEIIGISKNSRFDQITLVVHGDITDYRKPIYEDKWYVSTNDGWVPELINDTVAEHLFHKASAYYGAKDMRVPWRIDVLQKSRNAAAKFAVGDNVQLRCGEIVKVTAIDQLQVHAGFRVYDLSGVYLLSRSVDPDVAAYAAHFDIVSNLSREPAAKDAEETSQMNTEASGKNEKVLDWQLIKFVPQNDVPNRPKINLGNRPKYITQVVYLNRIPVGIIARTPSDVNWTEHAYFEDLAGSIPEKLPKVSSYHDCQLVFSSSTEVGLKRKITNRLRKIINNLNIVKR